MTTEKPQSPLSEAVEQAARAGTLYWDDLTAFAEEQADRLASGHYGLTDLTTAQVRLMRILVHHGVSALDTAINNVALLAYAGPPGGAAIRTMEVAVPVPAGVDVAFRVSDLVAGQHVIPRHRVRLDPGAAREAAATDLPVTVRVDTTGAAAGTYGGTITAADRRVDFQIAIDELGEP
jgi:hypothetical protein